MNHSTYILMYHGRPINDYYIDYIELLKNKEMNKETLIYFLKKIKRDLIKYLEQNRYPNQNFELSCCINNMDTLIDVIKLKC